MGEDLNQRPAPRTLLLMLLALLYVVMALYLPVSRLLPPGRSLATPLDAWLPLVPWLGPVYVLGLVPITLLPVVFYRRLPRDRFRQYAWALIAGALTSYFAYLLLPTEIRRPPLAEDPVARTCLSLAYAARSPRGLFPSGHAFYTALNAWFLWQVAGPRWRPWMALGSALVVAAATFTGLHYAVDILAGLALAAIALAVNWRLAARLPN